MSNLLDRDPVDRSVSLIPGLIYEWTPNGTLPVDLLAEPVLNQTAPILNRPVEGMEVVEGYHLIERVGEGCTGEVWRASGPGGFEVALKLVEAGRHGTDHELQSLSLMLAVRHANLSTIFGIWHWGDWTVIGMDLADGSLLDRYNKAVAAGATEMDCLELMDALHQAARGIDFLNGLRPAGVGLDSVALIHRDIKPANLLLVGGSLKVGDFGMVKSLIKEAGAVAESGFDEINSLLTAYSSPEVKRGEASSHSDQYSLAATYCHLRGGYVPATRSAATDSLDLSMLPARERSAVARAMAAHPGDRWPSCVDFVEALQAASRKIDRETDLASTPIMALSRMLTIPTSSRLRSPWPLAAVSLVAACLALMVWVFIPGGHSESTPQPDLRTNLADGASPVEILTPTIAFDLDSPLQAVDSIQPDAKQVSRVATSKLAPTNLQALVLAHRVLPTRGNESINRESRPNPVLSSAEAWRGLSSGLDFVQNRLDESIRTASHAGRRLVQSLERAQTLAAAAAVTSGNMPEPSAEATRIASLEAEPALLSEGKPPLVQEATSSLATMAQPAPALVIGAAAPAPAPILDSPLSELSQPRTATIIVRMPSSQAELVVRGDVGRGNPDEWYGPRRVIHSPPLTNSQEYIVGAFWTNPDGHPLTRSKKFEVIPGRLYEVDLRNDKPTAVEVNLSPKS